MRLQQSCADQLQVEDGHLQQDVVLGGLALKREAITRWGRRSGSKQASVSGRQDVTPGISTDSAATV